jgi:hypothetical protein
MSKYKKMTMILGACAALLGVAAPTVQAQTLPTYGGSVSGVSILPEAGLVAIRMEFESAEGTTPIVLCPGAATDEGKLTAFVPDQPQYRTLIEELLKRQGGTIEVRQGRNGCFVTRFSSFGY